MLPVILICVFMVKIAATKNVTVYLGTPKSCFFIGDNVKLICAVSSESNCCGSSRFWQDNSGTNILNNGISSNGSKYEEDYDNGTTGYNLIIKNVQKSDLGLNYKCLYRLKEDILFLSMDYICPSSEVNISGDCRKCAGKDYGWALLGTVIGTVIIIIAKLIIMITAKVKKVEPGIVLIVGGLTFIISAVVNLFALLIGYCTCHCVDGTDPWFIVLGLGTSVITGVIIIIIMKLKQVGKLKTVLIVGGVIVIIVGVLSLFALLIGYYTCHCVGGCWKCAGKGYGWAFLGTVIGTIIIIIAKVKICDTMCAPRDGLLFIIGVVFSAIFAVPIGYCMCQCVDGTDWLLIVSGLGTSLITGVIPIIYKKIKGEDMDFIDECCLVVIINECAGLLCAIIDLCRVPTVKVRRSSYVVTPGETMTLVCTVTSRLTISSVQWKRNVGDSTTTIDSNTNLNKYSGSTATTPSLTILEAASSDEGTYRCFASNCVGKGHSTTITVGK